MKYNKDLINKILKIKDKQNEYLQYLLLNFKVEKRQDDKEEALKTIKEMRTTLTEISTDLKDFYIRIRK